MNYDVPYERLGPGRFQLFCLSLLSREYRDIQVYPLDQADGGRDGISVLDFKNMMCIQVKFSAEPWKIKDPATWLREAVARETPKIARLAQAGVTRYRLVTNVKGTGALGRGSIDRTTAILAELPIHNAACMWRTDLDTRLAANGSLKWTYRELLTSDDVLTELVLSGLTEDRDRRSRAIKSLVVHQRRRDATVRFEQVDIRNDLLDLWIDVPISERINGAQLGATYFPTAVHNPEWKEFTEVGAAAYLLHSPTHGGRRTTVLGAPGQGKSTLLQYVCQVHRLRLLDAAGASNLGTDAVSPLRLPVRMDLRDLSSYLAGKDPWAGVPVADTTRSLAAFIARLVSHGAGGDRFDVADFKAIAEANPLLLACDGLDEVASAASRDELLDCLEEGIEVLAAVNLDLDVVVTSRPLAYSASRRLPRPGFGVVHLARVPHHLALNYARNWYRARGVDGEELAEKVTRVTSRLIDPGVAWLTENTMQLAIALQLIERHGGSTLSRRAKLYEGYMDLFLEREAEKSATVAANVEEIRALHAYLAWTLHAQAETADGETGLTTGQLRSQIGRWILDSVIPEDFLDELFEGVVVRVMALVARADDDLFDFEVQPLREYFAARHLYTTVPASSRDSLGTLPERFEALLRSPYWANVLALFAGMYEIGELASLVEGLRELRKDPVWGGTGLHRDWVIDLMNDRVFRSRKATIGSAVDLLLADVPSRMVGALMDGTDVRGHRTTLTDSYATGQLVEGCMQRLSERVPRDRRMAIGMLLRLNAPVATAAFERWREDVQRHSGRALSWDLVRGGATESFLHKLRHDELIDAVARATPTDELACTVASQVPYCLANENRLCELAIRQMLRGATWEWTGAQPSSFLRLHRLLGSSAASAKHATGGPGWAHEVFDGGGDAIGGAGDPIDTAMMSDVTEPMMAYVNEPTALGSMVNRLWETYGPEPGIIVSALAVASVESRARVSVVSSMSDHQRTDIVKLCLEMRKRRGWSHHSWWQRAVLSADDETQRVLVFGLLAWGEEHLLRELMDFVEPAVGSFDRHDLVALTRYLRAAGRPIPVQHSPGDATPRLQMLVGSRMPGRRLALARQLVSASAEAPVREWAAEELLRTIPRATSRMTVSMALGALADVRAVYVDCPAWAGYEAIAMDGCDLDWRVAEQVLSDPGRTPLRLVELAESAARVHAGSAVAPLSAIAEKERWFEE